MHGSRIRGVIEGFCIQIAALFFAGVSGSITAVVAAYMLVYCVGLPLSLAGGLLVASIGTATMTVGGIALAAFSLLAGLTIGTEMYIGLALPEDRWNGPMPGWLRALWATAAGALVGALPCAVMADAFLLAPSHALLPTLGSAAFATHLVSLGGLTGAMTGFTMERFRIWRRPSPVGAPPAHNSLARPRERQIPPRCVPPHSRSSRSIRSE